MAILISLVISLTTTPMLCSLLLQNPATHTRAALSRQRIYLRDDAGVLPAHTGDCMRHSLLVLIILGATIGLNFYLYTHIPYGFFPAGHGPLIGGIQADQSISFQLMEQKLAQLQNIVQADPAVSSVVGFTGGRQTNSGFVFVSLKPIAVRRISADLVIARLRRRLNQVAGARLFLQPAADLRTGGRQANAAYQFTLQADDTNTLYQWGPRLLSAMQRIPILVDVNSDQQQGGLVAQVNIDRPTAMRLGLSLNAIDNTLYDAFGQRQVSVIYSSLNQYHVVMELAPKYSAKSRYAQEHLHFHLGHQSHGYTDNQCRRGNFFRSCNICQQHGRNDRSRFSAQSGDQCHWSTGNSSASAGSSVRPRRRRWCPFRR